MKNRLNNLKKVLCLLIPLLILTSCSSSTEETTTVPGVTLKKSEPETHFVDIKQMQFIPAELKVKKGDRVVFVNKDIMAHNVTEQAGKSWSSSTLQSNESWTLVVTESSDYYCSIHPVMKGKIIAE